MREMDLKITKLKGKKQHISLNMHNTNVAKKLGLSGLEYAVPKYISHSY